MEQAHKDLERCTKEEAYLVQTGKCCDCEEMLADGPSGGLSINMYCLNPKCGSRFNDMGPFGVERISDAQPDAPPRPYLSNG